jgi:putative endonuclease
VTYERWLGKRGEEFAAQLLTSMGAELLCRNFRCDSGEIDLLLTHDDDLVAVEVKTRSNVDLEQPEEAITHRQLRRIVGALSHYAAEAGDELLERHWRVDVVAIQMDLDGTPTRCEHIRDAYPR